MALPEVELGTFWGGPAYVVAGKAIANRRVPRRDEGTVDPATDEPYQDLLVIHLGDRENYVADLEAGSTEPAQFTGRGGRSITATIDNFAEVNSMPSCATPLDL